MLVCFAAPPYRRARSRKLAAAASATATCERLRSFGGTGIAHVRCLAALRRTTRMVCGECRKRLDNIDLNSLGWLPRTPFGGSTLRLNLAVGISIGELRLAGLLAWARGRGLSAYLLFFLRRGHCPTGCRVVLGLNLARD